MKKQLGLVVVIWAMLGLGCAATPEPAPEPEAPAAEPQAAAEPAPVDTAPAQASFDPQAQRVFYFPYDSAEISADAREALAAHARFLGQNPQVSVVLEGHADERGSREYNLALGERRAQAVEQLMALQGASRNQLRVTSLGEERPAAMGHDESAWRMNRRVELQYSGL